MARWLWLILTDELVCILLGEVHGLVLVLAQVTLIARLILHFHFHLRCLPRHPHFRSYVLKRALVGVHQVGMKDEELNDEDHYGQICDKEEPGDARKGSGWWVCGGVESAQVRGVTREVAEVGS